MSPNDRRYTKEHEWVQVEGNVAAMGITDFAQGELGDIVYVELPSVGDSLESGAAFGVIESVKAVSDLSTPIAGEVIAINDELVDQPEIINEECYGAGWIIKLKPNDLDEVEALLDADSYRKIVSKRSA